jgi:hypothetical protein
VTKQRWSNPATGGLLAAVAVVGLGTWGWTLQSAEPADAVYRAIQAFVLSDGYRALGEASPAARPLLEATRWLGAALAFYAVGRLFWASLTARRVAFRARGWRGHIAVVGDTASADRLSDTASGNTLKHRVVQLRGPEQRPDQFGRLIRLPFHGFDHDGLDEAGARRAWRLVIDLADDGEAVDLALSAQRRYPGLSILTRLKDGHLLRSLHDLPGGKTLRAFSEAEAAAREVVRRHPLFLLAQDRGHGRIHALVIGDDDWVEALLCEIILSSRTLTLEKPALTVAVAQPDVFKRKLSGRYPELDREAMVKVVAFDAATGTAPLEGGTDPITAAYVAYSDGGRSLAVALAVRRQALSGSGFDGPLFTRTSDYQGLVRPAAGAKLSSLDMIPFGSLTDVIHATGVLSETADRAERDWHEAYLRLNPTSDAAVPWDQLSEEYRLSNRRAVAHIYAKLHDAGFDLRPWLATAKPWDELPALAPGEALFGDEPELMRLAELEHERWNADRRLLGWRFGPTKDPVRKVQPYLIDFADLPPEIQRYDIELIRELDQILPRKKGGLRRA